MTDGIRLIRHTPKGIPDAGSYEVRYEDGRESVYFYWDDNAGRRAITGHLTKAEAEEKAKAFARAERDRLK